MSRDSIKVGRYSKERHRENKTIIAKRKKQQEVVPYLMSHSDSQDIIIKCNMSFSEIFQVRWENEIKNFQDEFDFVKNCLELGSFPKDDFMDIYKVTGAEIDCRRHFIRFMELIQETSLKRYMQLVRELPGIDQLSEDDFCRIIISRKEDIFIIIACLGGAVFEDQHLHINLDTTHKISISRQQMIHFSSKPLIEKQEEICERAKKINLTLNELIFMVALNALKPTEGIPNLNKHYQRFSLALTRFLQSTHGENYHKRLHDIIMHVSYIREILYKSCKDVERNRSYVEEMYQRKLIRDVLFQMNFDESLDMLKSCKI